MKRPSHENNRTNHPIIKDLLCKTLYHNFDNKTFTEVAHKTSDFDPTAGHANKFRTFSLNDSKSWSLHSIGKLSVKSPAKHLVASNSIDKFVYEALWKSNCPNRVNGLLQLMIYGSTNCSTTIQRKFPSLWLSLSIFPLCLADSEDFPHIFFECNSSKPCWWKLFSLFNI